ncbi:sodium/proline symporter PutP [Psychrosphaera sp. B3R10]|uniref:sodium/proline symporter PutP n=1 Tax=unclassified Psychrosphaera TaxID=2641570 RepID=UPI001C08F6D4|nr:MULTISPECIES: sodium/proline symporter PutP [unclassified Psychrosphaera]MBU2882996.1 sodium/proline symporter PutP [Psychrosphaera sp. I2R16]MBU2991393.1 sodium/proline symporter PutP [Psychrosphaera sp. B3R10]MDO6720282.1 sodium/proline symporter PutP [Psychrosphaera sp. 1_MG-2023]
MSIDYSVVSIVLYFVLLIAIGFYAMRQSTSNNSEYLLGGRQVGPNVTALSAGASDMSGWMLLGLPGAAYTTGIGSIWLAIGLVIGAYVNYLIVAPKLRVYTELANDSLTIPEFMSRRFMKDKSHLRLIASVVIILFFTVYTASGLVAGGKLFSSAFATSYSFGVFATVGIVVAYTVMGGFLAVSLTDFVQGVIMLIALIAVPYVAFISIDTVAQSTSFGSQFWELLTKEANFEIVASISLFTWGLGYFGQPHIIVRFMAISSHKKLPQARRVGINWMIVSIIGALLTGIVGAAYIKSVGTQLSDPETIFIHLSQILFHPLVAGWLLAAILAAIMSTISSQLLVSSSSLVEDLYKVYFSENVSPEKSLIISRACVVVVAALASLIALAELGGVLKLVSSAWAGFGAAFGPVILFSLWWKQLTEQGAIAGVLAGAITVFIWGYIPLLPNGLTLSSEFYELLPAFLISSLVIVIVSKRTQVPCEKTTELFELTKNSLS